MARPVVCADPSQELHELHDDDAAADAAAAMES